MKSRRRLLLFDQHVHSMPQLGTLLVFWKLFREKLIKLATKK